MLGLAMYHTIETLYRRGFNKTAIAKMTGHDWKTVSKVISSLKHGQLPKKAAHPNQLDKHKEQLLQWLEANLSGVRIHQLLQAQGVTLSYSSVKTYLRTLKAREDICIRFITKPGEEAQVDFGYVGRLPDVDGKLKKAWVFNMRLSYSRLDYYQVVYDQRVETFIACHRQAFEYFGGVPEVVKIDNLKAAILTAHFYQPIYQTAYKQFADYYGFQILPCRVKKPQEKGKVEAGIKYIKGNFFAGRTFTDHAQLNQQLMTWLERTANARVHGTTRKVPQTLFADEEKQALKPLPKTAYCHVELAQRDVYRDCHIYLHYNYYSVPYEYVGKRVDIQLAAKQVTISHDGQTIAIHARLTGRGGFSTQEAHYPAYKQVFSPQNQAIYAQKMNEIGDYANQLFNVLVTSKPYHWLQTVKGIMALRQRFSDAIINLSCYRALAYGAIQYRQIKSICESGCYHLPIDQQEKVH